MRESGAVWEGREGEGRGRALLGLAYGGTSRKNLFLFGFTYFDSQFREAVQRGHGKTLNLR